MNFDVIVRGNSFLFMIIPYSGTLDILSCSDLKNSAVEYVFTELFHDKFAVSVFKVGHALSIDHADFEAMNNNLKISSVRYADFVWFLCHGEAPFIVLITLQQKSANLYIWDLPKQDIRPMIPVCQLEKAILQP